MPVPFRARRNPRVLEVRRHGAHVLGSDVTEPASSGSGVTEPAPSGSSDTEPAPSGLGKTEPVPSGSGETKIRS